MIYTFVVIDGNKYAVASSTYIRNWQRSFTTQLAAGIVRLNFVDRGPGIRTYSMTLQIQDWGTDSLPYKAGVTQSFDTQRVALEASYNKISKAISFLDPFGEAPNIPGTSTPGGVYFTNYSEVIPNYATGQKPYMLAEIQLTEATQVVA